MWLQCQWRKQSVSVPGENGILGLNSRTGHLTGRVHCRFQLALLSIVNRQLSHKQWCETKISTTTKSNEGWKYLYGQCTCQPALRCGAEQHPQFLSAVTTQQLLAASSILLVRWSGWNTWWYVALRPSSVDTSIYAQFQNLQVTLQ